MSDYTNISGMDLRSAKEYIAGYIATLRQTQIDVRKAEEELAVWDGRVKLAAEHGRPDLESAARTRADELRAKIGRLKVEEQQLLADIDRMKTQLKTMEHQPTFTVDAELLLAQLEQVVGEEDATASKFRDTEADRALDELKRKLGMPVPERAPQQTASAPESGPQQTPPAQGEPASAQEPQTGEPARESGPQEEAVPQEPAPGAETEADSNQEEAERTEPDTGSAIDAKNEPETTGSDPEKPAEGDAP